MIKTTKTTKGKNQVSQFKKATSGVEHLNIIVQTHIFELYKKNVLQVVSESTVRTSDTDPHALLYGSKSRIWKFSIYRSKEKKLNLNFSHKLKFSETNLISNFQYHAIKMYRYRFVKKNLLKYALLPTKRKKINLKILQENYKNRRSPN